MFFQTSTSCSLAQSPRTTNLLLIQALAGPGSTETDPVHTPALSPDLSYLQQNCHHHEHQGRSGNGLSLARPLFSMPDAKLAVGRSGAVEAGWHINTVTSGATHGHQQ